MAVANLHDLPAGIALLQIPIRIWSAVPPLVNALGLAFWCAAVGDRADPEDEVWGEVRPVAGL